MLKREGKTMYKKYKSFLKRYISINVIEWTTLQQKLQVAHFKKGQTIHIAGNVCRNLYFINSGLARAYAIGEDGKDFTWSIFFNDANSKMDNLFVVDYESFLNRSESQLAIDALEDCELVYLNRDDLEMLYNEFKKSEHFGRLMSEEAYSLLHNRILNLKLKSAKERFEEFMQETPYLLEKVPQYYIASYLGITPQYLSKLKRELV